MANIGQQSLIIGYPWLVLHNPEINWAKQKIHVLQCPSECNTKPPVSIPRETPESLELESGDKIYAISFQTEPLEETSAEILAIEYVVQDKPEALPSRLIPEEYCEYEDIFSKDEFDVLPP